MTRRSTVSTAREIAARSALREAADHDWSHAGFVKLGKMVDASHQSIRNWLGGKPISKRSVEKIEAILITAQTNGKASKTFLSTKGRWIGGTGRTATDVAKVSKVLDTHDAFKAICRETKHLEVLVTTENGSLSKNITKWTRARIQTAAERLAASAVRLMQVNRNGIVERSR